MTTPTRTPTPKDPRRRLEENLRYLGLTRVLECCSELLARGAKDNLSHLDFLDAVMAEETAARFARRVERRVQRARFPVPKAIDAYQWDHPAKIDRARVLALFDFDFLAKHRNALLIGGPGLGKTHLAIALGRAACQKGHSVLFTTAMEMINHLQAAQSDSTLLKKLRAYLRCELLIIDELGYLPIDKLGADLVFQVVSQRYERGSIVLTTNRVPKEWPKVFNDATVASAVLDRLADRSEVIVIEGKSYRAGRESS